LNTGEEEDLERGSFKPPEEESLPKNLVVLAKGRIKVSRRRERQTESDKEPEITKKPSSMLSMYLERNDSPSK
jgi:hypothetical protein